MKDVDYASGAVPPGYRCATCGAHRVKLWRPYQGPGPLLCVACAEQNQLKRLGWERNRFGLHSWIGWYMPAVPLEDGLSFYAPNSIPADGSMWWNALPMALPAWKFGPVHGPVEVVKPASFSPSGRPLSEPVEVRVSGLRGTPAQVAAELRTLADEVEHGERFVSSCCGCKVSVGAPEKAR